MKTSRTNDYQGLPVEPALLNAYVLDAERGDASAARQLLCMHIAELGQTLDNPLHLYLWEVLNSVVKLKDKRDCEIAEGKRAAGSEATFYRNLAKSLRLESPRGRPRKSETLDKATHVAEGMHGGKTLLDAASDVDDIGEHGGQDAYTRNKKAAKANAAMRRESKK